MPRINNSFKDLLCEYTRRTGISDSRLAYRADKIDRQVIYYWKNGKLPSVRHHNTVRKFADILMLTDSERKVFFKAAKIDEKYPHILHKQKIVPIIGPTTHPSQFFGRNDILERIFNNWRQYPLEHVVVIGNKGSGKTSLLNYLKSIHNCNDLREGQRHNWLKQQCKFISVDFANVAVHSLEGFLRHLLMELHLRNDARDLYDLTEILNDSLTKPTVILMDNIKFGLEVSELDKRFWQYIRYLGDNNPNLGFCMTSSISLEKLNQCAKKVGKTSPAENIFTEIKLDSFSVVEAKELLNHVPFPQKDVEWILKKSKCWPAFVQILCKIRLSRKTKLYYQKLSKINIIIFSNIS
ncbi:MAG: AAA family ATPase [Candidatus Marithrix sp.]